MGKVVGIMPETSPFEKQLIEFAETVHSLAMTHGSDETYGLLCRLAGTVSKQYSDEEQIECLQEECEMFYKNPKVFVK